MSTALLLSGCFVGQDSDAPTISKNEDSEYEKTFADLNLGILFDFDFYLPRADERWVNLWVERYVDGEMESEPITQLSYGNSPSEIEEGKLGFGLIETHPVGYLAFLFAPGVGSQPTEFDIELESGFTSTWSYAIENEAVELELEEPEILAVYRKSQALKPVDLQDEESVERMIEEDEIVMLLKIKVEDRVVSTE